MGKGLPVKKFVHMARIRALVDFLRIGEPSLEEILRFICLDTLYAFSAFAVNLAVVRLDGTVATLAGYGRAVEAWTKVPERSVKVDSPINRALRTGEIVDCGNSETFLFSGPGYHHELFPDGFAQCFGWPIPGVGSVFTFCSQATVLDVECEEFLIIVGELLSLSLTKYRTGFDLGRSPKGVPPQTHGPLTALQWSIFEEIQQGRTNTEIVQSLGISQTILKRELAQIYKQFGVKSNKEIQKLKSAKRGFSPMEED